MPLKTNTQIGRQGEQKAIDFLKSKDYQILETNYRYSRSEIDIIAGHNNTIVFVEVKFRKNQYFGHPEEFVSQAQAERVHLAAEQYTYENNWSGNIRFDIIAITSTLEIIHFEDAF